MISSSRKCKTVAIRMHRGKRNCSKIVEEYVHQHFHEWFIEYVARNEDGDITSEIEWLAKGANDIARRFDGYNIHGIKFRKKKREQGLRTQNSGVVMCAITKRFSSGRDPIENSSNDMYYGKLVDIIELDYYGMLRVVLFKCIWVHTTLNKGVKIDQFGITSVNISRLIHTDENEIDEPFILAADARMVFDIIWGKGEKASGQTMLESLRGQEGENNRETFQDQNQQTSNHQLDDQHANVNVTNAPSDDDAFDSFSNPNETQSQQKEEPLLVKVGDTCTGEITIRKMQANQVCHLEKKTKKVIVELNGNGQGNDNGSNLLVRFLGKLARNSTIYPISVERWDCMPENNCKIQWKYVEENFEFDYAVGIKWVMSTLGERWKAYKYKLRCKHFYPNKSKEDILANPPSGVDCVDWTAFVHHYKNYHMKKQSLQNTRNRKMLKVSHAGGSKSNARRGQQMEIQLGRPVCRSEVILSTLLKKDGNCVNEDGKVVADKISEHLYEYQERVATVGVPSKVLAYPDDAIGKVYGVEHLGRVRG
ncbi:putative transposase, Ptta/En/Spm, plant [Sesbania bispinosa]|nr:putative transposase, Ptta/En/Spm, plant [Sesbania bispinosa]